MKYANMKKEEIKLIHSPRDYPFLNLNKKFTLD